MITPVDVVLPCLDEAAALPAVLSTLPAGWRAIVVDNGSRDGSAAVARTLGASVVLAPVRGYGSACAAGLEAVTAEYVVFCDCDASVDLADAARVLAPVRADAADLVLGRRRALRAGAWPLHARVANRALAAHLRRRTGAALHDLGPVRAARTERLRGLDVRDRRSGYPLETVVRAAAAGWRLAEVDIRYAPRIGRSKVTGTLLGTLHAVSDMRAVLRSVPAR